MMATWSLHIVYPAVRVTCEAPFQPAANSSLVCSDGAWLPPPRCVPAKCTELPDAPRNGMVVAPNMDHGMVGKFEVSSDSKDVTCYREADEYLMCNVFVSVSGRIYAQGQQHDPVLFWKLDRHDALVQRR